MDIRVKMYSDFLKKYNMQRAVKQLESEIKKFLWRTISEKDLELLQRYDMDPICAWMDEYIEWEYVRWDSLIQLLK